MFDKLNGMFSFIIFNDTKNLFFVQGTIWTKIFIFQIAMI